MEKDDEAKGAGNSYDFNNRMYDSRLGRWLSIDPIGKLFAFWSPYHFSSNSPIIAKDLDGLQSSVGINVQEEIAARNSIIVRAKNGENLTFDEISMVAIKVMPNYGNATPDGVKFDADVLCTSCNGLSGNPYYLLVKFKSEKQIKAEVEQQFEKQMKVGMDNGVVEKSTANNIENSLEPSSEGSENGTISDEDIVEQEEELSIDGDIKINAEFAAFKGDIIINKSQFNREMDDLAAKLKANPDAHLTLTTGSACGGCDLSTATFSQYTKTETVEVWGKTMEITRSGTAEELINDRIKFIKSELVKRGVNRNNISFGDPSNTSKDVTGTIKTP